LRAQYFARSVVSATIGVSSVTIAADRASNCAASVPVLAGQVAAELLLGRVDVGVAAVGSPCDGRQVDVPAGHQPGQHVGDEGSPAGIGERSGDADGEGG